MVFVGENVTKSKVVLPETVLPGGIPGITPALSFDEIVRGDVAPAFHHQKLVLSQTWSPVPEVQVNRTGVVPVTGL
jgi:hypothetical protein